jgi:hypothetical protein
VRKQIQEPFRTLIWVIPVAGGMQCLESEHENVRGRRK